MAKKKSTTDDISEEKSEKPEGGYGWLCVLGCALMHVLLGGMARSYGVIYIELLERFGQSAASTAWVGGLMTAIRMGFSPMATGLSNKFGYRKVVMCGGLLMSLGSILSAFAPNLWYLFFSYSILAGFGGTMIYAPAFIVINWYFDKKRAIATGLSTGGSGIGVFSFPPLIRFLLDYYGYLGMWLILGALMANNICVGALYRKPKFLKRKHAEMRELVELKKNNRKNSAQNGDVVENDISVAVVELEESQVPLRTNEKSENIVKDDNNDDNSEKASCWKSLCTTREGKPVLDLSLLKNASFLLFCFCILFTAMGYIAGQMLVPAIAYANGVDKTRSAFLLSMIGISDLIGRVGSGFIFDSRFCRNIRLSLYNVCLFLSGALLMMVPLGKTFAGYACISMLHGLLCGVIVSQRSVILGDMFGLEILSSSFGIVVCFQGMGVFAGPALAGVIKDVSGFYDGSFIFTGGAMVLGAFLLLSDRLRRWVKQRMSATSSAPI